MTVVMYMLRRAIMTNHQWLGNAEETKDLEKQYEDDISKWYHIICPEETALKRKGIQEYCVLNRMRLNHKWLLYCLTRGNHMIGIRVTVLLTRGNHMIGIRVTVLLTRGNHMIGTMNSPVIAS